MAFVDSMAKPHANQIPSPTLSGVCGHFKETFSDTTLETEGNVLAVLESQNSKAPGC